LVKTAAQVSEDGPNSRQKRREKLDKRREVGVVVCKDSRSVPNALQTLLNVCKKIAERPKILRTVIAHSQSPKRNKLSSGVSCGGSRRKEEKNRPSAIKTIASNASSRLSYFSRCTLTGK
jgi:hypothetical protein